MASIHSILPRVAIASLVPLLALLIGGYHWVTRRYGFPSSADIFRDVQGRWVWSGEERACLTDWHDIRFSPDHRVMTITSAIPYKRADGQMDSIAVYDVRQYTRTTIRGAIRGETRLTVDGEPVVWDLVLRTPERYVWHRTDWPRGTFTNEIQRCPDLI